MIEEQLVAICDTAGITAYPARAPDTAVVPFAVYTRVATERVTALSGPDGVAITTIQLDLYHSTYSQVANLGDVLRLLLNGYSDEASGIQYVSLENEVDLSADPDADGLYRRMYEYKVTHSEA